MHFDGAVDVHLIAQAYETDDLRQVHNQSHGIFTGHACVHCWWSIFSQELLCFGCVQKRQFQLDTVELEIHIVTHTQIDSVEPYRMH